MKTQQELAQARVDVKRALRKELNQVPQNETQAEAAKLINFTEALSADDYLLDNLYRLAFKFNNQAEYAGFDTPKQRVLIAAREMVRSIIDWLKNDPEAGKLATLWDLQADITVGRKVAS